MTVEKFNGIFDKEHVNRLEVTWNSDTIDMIRCKYIIEAFKKYNILDNVVRRGYEIKDRLSKIDSISGLRTKGLIIGFDLKDSETRDKFMRVLYSKGMICNSTGKMSIRLRPNLNLSKKDALLGCNLIEESLNEI